ncbi:DeoR family transcriptional regulator [Modestobacter sp. I12A-02628]|uniref:Lactose phosphotransferase system repressor n=1 Tax=Goekera deserti TaxID=2497753 RepID=A0A7K3W9G1_9ACTN|nr:DeoR/GlpR family DNA-binding transcription regulator [Goekera deserti]MPQ98800.1 DeoR family transcriptional regulator [Goekera deserti]NDI49702.1 DeoR family transcriptional regulator [Goekera deserti]NEL53105.1 DeoR/GlpR transcriptional regulator [Goekera deserti]
MYAEERQHAIAGLVSQRGRVAVTAVAERFGVTTETVRRDLAVLERAGMLRRVHGGAVPTAALSVTEPGLAERRGSHPAQKLAIATLALSLVPEAGGSIVLDGGSSTAALAGLLPGDRDLLAVTNSVPIATRVAASPGIGLHVLGGRVRGVTQTAVGSTTEAALRELRVDVTFLGTNGLTPDHGFTTPDEAEAAVKRAMVRAGQRVVVLADSTKLGREHLVRFASAEDVDVLVTDAGADPETVTELENQGIEVLVA